MVRVSDRGGDRHAMLRFLAVISVLVICTIAAVLHDSERRAVLLSPDQWRSVAPTYIGGGEARSDLSAFFDSLHDESRDIENTSDAEGGAARASTPEVANVRSHKTPEGTRDAATPSRPSKSVLTAEQSLAARERKLHQEHQLLALEKKELSVKTQLEEATEERLNFEKLLPSSSSRRAVVKGKSGYKRVGSNGDKDSMAADARLSDKKTREARNAKRDREVNILEQEVETLSHEVRAGVDAKKSREVEVLEKEVETLSAEVSDEAQASSLNHFGVGGRKSVARKKPPALSSAKDDSHRVAAKAFHGTSILGDAVRPAAHV
jgi:hypothetical protein